MNKFKLAFIFIIIYLGISLNNYAYGLAPSLMIQQNSDADDQLRLRNLMLQLSNKEISKSVVRILSGSAEDIKIVSDLKDKIFESIKDTKYSRVLWHNTNFAFFDAIRVSGLKRRHDGKIFFQFYDFQDNGFNFVLTELARSVLNGEDTYGTRFDLNTHGVVIIALKDTNFILGDSARIASMDLSDPDISSEAFRFLDLRVGNKEVESFLENYFKYNGITGKDDFLREKLAIIYLKITWLNRLNHFFKNTIKKEIIEAGPQQMFIARGV